MNIVLNDVEVRVLGSLIEKDITTPDYYPLSLNALVDACNQKNNRDPVMTLDEAAVREALDDLHNKNLAGSASGADSRVTKYEHRLQRDPPLARVLPRQPGTKESRYMHLLSGDMKHLGTADASMAQAPSPAYPVTSAAIPSTDRDRITHLEDEVATLGEEVTNLKQLLERFRT